MLTSGSAFGTPQNVGEFRSLTDPFGAGSPRVGGAPSGGSSLLSSLLSNLQGNIPGIIGGGADLLSQLLGRGTGQQGFQDLESQISGGIGEQRQALSSSLGLLSPFQQAGGQAAQEELGLLRGGADPTAQVNRILSQFQQSPAQRASIRTGLDAVQNRLESQGLSQSGAEQEALEKFAQNQTSQQQQQFLQSVLGARGQTLGGLGQLGGLGLGAARAGTQAQLQTAQNIADLMESLGQTQRAQQQQQGGDTSGIIGSIGSLASDFF